MTDHLFSAGQISVSDRPFVLDSIGHWISWTELCCKVVLLVFDFRIWIFHHCPGISRVYVPVNMKGKSAQSCELVNQSLKTHFVITSRTVLLFFETKLLN